jgi:glycosyltransferase involved in cell wall biosynthesis
LLREPIALEAFGLAQLETMARGCPVRAANIGAIPEITAGVAILFDPHNPRELSAEILKVTGEPDVCRDLV